MRRVSLETSSLRDTNKRTQDVCQAIKFGLERKKQNLIPSIRYSTLSKASSLPASALNTKTPAQPTTDNSTICPRRKRTALFSTIPAKRPSTPPRLVTIEQTKRPASQILTASPPSYHLVSSLLKIPYLPLPQPLKTILRLRIPLLKLAKAHLSTRIPLINLPKLRLSIRISLV